MGLISFEQMRTFFVLLTIAAVVVILVALALAVGRRASPAIARTSSAAREAIRGRALGLGFTVALVATLGSLYLSEIAHLVPCTLCWYQRIAMYPLAILLGIAAVRRDGGIRPYAITLAGVGVAISGYHYLTQLFPSLETGACSASVPCNVRYIWSLGFISIPFMALSAFLLIIVFLTADPGIERRPDRDSSAMEVSVR